MEPPKIKKPKEHSSALIISIVTIGTISRYEISLKLNAVHPEVKRS